MLYLRFLVLLIGLACVYLCGFYAHEAQIGGVVLVGVVGGFTATALCF